MSLLFSRAGDLSAFVPPAPGFGGRAGSPASSSQMLRMGATWACLRLRADLESSLPWDVYRKVDGRSVEVPAPPFFRDPAAGMLWNEWLYATRMDLDRYGNTFGRVVARDGALRPSQIELSEAQDWSMVVSGKTGAWEYQYRGVPQDKRDVWHERQYVVSGLPMGLSPVAHAAIAGGLYLSAQQFSLDWFQTGASPSGVLQNTKREVPPDRAAEFKALFRESVARRDVLVTGNDWQYTPAASAASDAKFLDAMQATDREITRFFGVPGDLIDVETATGHVTYANVTQRNLQLLTLNIGPAVKRREDRFSHDLVAAPRFVKANTDAILRMDAKGKLEVIATGVEAKLYTHDEGRGLLELEPLTDEQIAKEHQIDGPKPVPGLKNGSV